MATLKLGTQSVNDIKKGTTNIPSAYLGGYQFSFSSGDTPPAPHDYSQDYLTFRALEDGTFKFSGNSINYSLDDGATWTELASDTDTPTVNSGQTIMWKASLTATASSNGIGTFSSSGRFEIEGNTMSLKYGDNFSGQTTFSDNYSLRNLFNGCSGVTNAENMVLPATTLTNFCYHQMFYGCTSLTTAPELSATTLSTSCYYQMFQGCTSLTAAPSLPATTLANSCYSSMFYYCTSLTTAPTLSATSLSRNCFNSMFQGCSALTTVPSNYLLATYLYENCYYSMFRGCTSLTTAPELPATTLANQCYQFMFYGCSSLTTAPTLLATTLVKRCYNNMFYGCSNLSSITCLATDISAQECTYRWVRGVASSGTFTTPSSTSWTTGNNGIPKNWTVQDYQEN